MVGDNDFYLCKTESCEVVYFNSITKAIINKSQVKVPVWFKKDADPKYICYCNRVTEKQVIDAVKIYHARNLKDVMKLTDAMKTCDCAINNPTGKCCGSVLQATINKALESIEPCGRPIALKFPKA